MYKMLKCHQILLLLLVKYDYLNRAGKVKLNHFSNCLCVKSDLYCE